MVKYTPQQEWIKGRGVLLWLAFFFSELGAGIYFVCLFGGPHEGMLLGWLINLLLGGVIHLLYLGNPARSWRMLLRPRESELSRGLWISLLFMIFGAIQLGPVVFSGLPWNPDSTTLSIINGLLCLLVITHGFMTMGVIRAISAWSSTVLTPLALVSGLWMGSQVREVLLALMGHDIAMAELWSRWSLICFILMTAIYLLGTYHGSGAGRISVKNMVRGEWSKQFVVLVVLVGLAVPAAITLYIGAHDIEETGPTSLVIRCICVLVGDASLRYGIMRNGLYQPLV